MSLGMGYEVARPTGVCALSGETIEPGQAYVAALYEGEDQLERRDYVEGSWDRAPRAGLFGYWAATMPEPNQSPSAFVSQGEIAELFTHLGEMIGSEGEEEPRQVTFRFILALMLMRKRWLRLEGTTRDAQGREVMRLSWAPVAKQGDERVEVVDPGMDESSIADAIEQVGTVMGGVDQGDDS